MRSLLNLRMQFCFQLIPGLSLEKITSYNTWQADTTVLGNFQNTMETEEVQAIIDAINRVEVFIF